MANIGFPAEVVDSIKDSIDCNIYFFGTKVSEVAMYAVLAGAMLLFVGVYVLMNVLKKARKR